MTVERLRLRLASASLRLLHDLRRANLAIHGGRPKGARGVKRSLKYELSPETLKETFLEEAYRLVSINTGKGEEQIPIAQALIRALGVNAAKGHINAQRLFARTLFEIEAAKRSESERFIEGIVDYKQS